MQFFLRKLYRHQLLGILFLTSLTLCLGISYLSASTQGLGQLATAQPANTRQLVQQGVDRYQEGDFKGAIPPWETALTTYQSNNDRPNTAVVLENLARTYQQLGQLDQSIQSWQQVVTLYRQLDDAEKVGRMLTELAQTHSKLGQHRRAITLLCNPIQENNAAKQPIQCDPESALGIAQNRGDHLGEIAALGSLGNAYQSQGDYEQAIKWLEQGLERRTETENATAQANLLNSLGNAYANRARLSDRRAGFIRQTTTQVLTPDLEKLALNTFRGSTVQSLDNRAKEDNATALRYFEQSFAIAEEQGDPLGMITALLNGIPLYSRAQQISKVASSQQAALNLLERLPASRGTVFATMDLANLLQSAPDTTDRVAGSRCFRSEENSQVQTLLQRAIQVAQQIGDRRAESFALGELGHLYECRQNYTQALDLTQKARWAAADPTNQDSLYLWEWQTGRILKQQSQNNTGDDAVTLNTQALKFYEQAIATLEKIRGDILIANRDLQFDFRDKIEPIYRELAALRLERESLAASPVPAQDSKQNLSQVLNTIDSLKLAELQNYFGDDCVISALSETPVEQVDQSTAVLNTIIFSDRTAVILILPDGSHRLHWIQSSEQNLTVAVNQYRLGLQQFRVNFDLSRAEKLYNWLVRPFEKDLVNAQVKTLVFVQDGIFRSVPMSALYDGQQYLIQKYAIATTPSLQLTAPEVLNRKQLKAMVLGLTQAATIGDRDFAPLESVAQEIERILALLPGSRQLRNEEFTRDRLQQELSAQAYPIVHIATHAEFGPEPEDTFLVTGNNKKLVINEFDQLIRSVTGPKDAIELLTLTACQTAVGDDRAALGLAGVALQSGAKSTLASLWSINDAATAQLAERFYQELLKPGVNKAAALRAAQLTLLEAEYTHPFFWAPFILIGNWL